MGTLTLWIAFNVGVALLLLLDLGVFHRRAHAISFREAFIESFVWVALSVAFGLWIFVSHGRAAGLEFFAGYVIEKSLSVDNIFVFILVFQYFRVDSRYQHRLLFWGVLGALIMRGVMIGAGAILIERFAWILYILGAFLVYGGFKLFGADHMVQPEKNSIVHWAGKLLPMSVIVLETTDLALAVDSVAAVFGVTRDPFIVYSSNVCAILGLRALYFLLAGILPYFQYLDEGLAIVLMFIGGKMLVEPWIHISTQVSLSVVGSVIAIAVVASVIAARWSPLTAKPAKEELPGAATAPPPISETIRHLADPDAEHRAQAAHVRSPSRKENLLSQIDHRNCGLTGDV